MEKLNILVTGGARGIGHGIVRELMKSGHNVGFCGRTQVSEYISCVENLEKEFGTKARYYSCDVSNKDDREKMLNDFLRDFGSLDSLVNNAGVAPEVRADMLDMDESSFERLININVKGPFFLTQAATKIIMENKNGKFHSIINVGSVSAVYGSINRGEYCISKAAVAMASKLWSIRLADENIGVYEIRPGVIKSDMTSTVSAKYDKMIADGLTLQKRWGEPEDIGKVVNSLVTGVFSYSTGQVFNVDGGLTIERF